MKTLGHMFRSRARTELLRALYYQSEGVGLRALARIAHVGVRSAELALEALELEDLVLKNHVGNRSDYKLNRIHADYPILAAVFDAATRASVQAQCIGLEARALQLLPLNQQALSMLSHARGQQHVT